jgi:acetyl-CoA carboxylase carboxyltransferase component
VTAVSSNRIGALPDQAERDAFVQAKRAEYDEDIDIVRLASELVVDAVVEPEDLRAELVARYAAAAGKDRHFSRRRHGVTPV